MDFFQRIVLKADAGPWCVCGCHFDEVVPFIIPIPGIIAKPRFHKFLRFKRLQLPAEFKVACIRLLEGAEECLPQDQICVLNTPHVLRSSVHEAVSITICFQGHKLPDFSTPVELLLAFKGGLDVSVNEGFLDDLPKLWTKLASSEHFQCVSVHGFKMMNDPIRRFKNIFWSSLSDLHSFPHIAQIQSQRKLLLSHRAPQYLSQPRDPLAKSRVPVRTGERRRRWSGLEPEAGGSPWTPGLRDRSLAGTAGGVCGSRLPRPPLLCSRGCSCRSAPAGSERSALGPPQRL